MTFKEYLPSPQLAGLVDCYWQFTIPPDAGSGQLNHVFPPDGCCALVCFTSAYGPEKRIIFMGPTTVIREVNVYPGSVSTGIRLKPGCSRWFHPGAPAELLDSVTGFAGEYSEDWQIALFSRIAETNDLAGNFDARLLTLREQRPFTQDDRIGTAVDIIRDHSGQISAEQVASACGLSLRQLQRLFKDQTGITLKKYSQIRRLRSAIIDLAIQKRLPMEMILERGFTDMAHYYKSFRTLTGYNIEKFFSHIYGIDHHLK